MLTGHKAEIPVNHGGFVGRDLGSAHTTVLSDESAIQPSHITSDDRKSPATAQRATAALVGISG
jgi:hypothetical protein